MTGCTLEDPRVAPRLREAVSGFGATRGEWLPPAKRPCHPMFEGDKSADLYGDAKAYDQMCLSPQMAPMRRAYQKEFGPGFNYAKALKDGPVDPPSGSKGNGARPPAPEMEASIAAQPATRARLGPPRTSVARLLGPWNPWGVWDRETQM